MVPCDDFESLEVVSKPISRRDRKGRREEKVWRGLPVALARRGFRDQGFKDQGFRAEAIPGVYGASNPRKLAVTALAAFMLTVQTLPDVLSQPFQPVNTVRGPGLAVSVTLVPLTKDAEHVLPQLMAAGLDVTVPDPRPDF